MVSTCARRSIWLLLALLDRRLAGFLDALGSRRRTGSWARANGRAALRHCVVYLGVKTPRYLGQVAAALRPRLTPRSYRSDGMDNLGELRAATASIEQSSGYNLFDAPLALSPPLAPLASPVTTPPPAPLASPAPAWLPSPPPPRTAHNWTDDEIELVVGLFYKLGPRFRRISRCIAGRSEDAVRQVLKRRGLLAPRSSPVRRRRSTKAPRWTRSEDRRLLEAFEAVPRHKRGNVPWRQVRAAAGLNRLPQSLRNRLARLSEC